MSENITSVNVYFPFFCEPKPFVDIFRGGHKRTYRLTLARWHRLHWTCIRVGGRWSVAAPRGFCKVIWRRAK